MDNALMALARANVYDLLARHYTVRPDQRFVDWVGSPSYIGFLKELSKTFLDGSVDQEIETLARWLEEASTGARTNDEVADALLADWTMVLRGVHPSGSPPPPFESVYKEGAMFGAASAEVRRIYRKHSLGLDAAVSDEPPDHIGLELEFMAALCRREAETWSRGEREPAMAQRAAARSFLREHLDWVDMFAQELGKRSMVGFYASIARITAAWLAVERCGAPRY